MRLVRIMFAFGLMSLSLATQARGDGGTVRAMERIDDCRITVFTSPTPLLTGPIDVSVLLQDAATGEVIANAHIEVTARAAELPDFAIKSIATSELAANKLLQAAQLDLPQTGWWNAEVNVQRIGQQTIRVQLEFEAAPPPPRWTILWPWFCWPAIPIALFCLGQCYSRRTRPSVIPHQI